jgi:hypothetical protein
LGLEEKCVVFFAGNLESVVIFILKTAVKVGVAVFLLDYGIGIYKKQKVYDKSAAKVNNQIEKAQEVIIPSSGVSDIVFKLTQAKSDKEFLEFFFNPNERKELYLTSFLNNVINLAAEMKRRNENDLRISQVKNEILINIFFDLSLERFGLFFRFDDYFKTLMSRTTNSQELLDDWLKLRKTETQFNQKVRDFWKTLAEAHNENEEEPVFKKRINEFCKRNGVNLAWE